MRVWTFLPYEIVSFTSLSCFRESARPAIRSLNGALSPVQVVNADRSLPVLEESLTFFCLFVSICIEDLHPCISVTCYYFGQCKASSPAEAHCACQTDCPTFEDHVCGSNGKTYQNHCFYKLDVCQTRTNITVLHTGSCYEFIMQRGRFALHLDTSDVQCKAAVFQNQTFNDFRRVHVQTTINYFNETGSFVHDAAVTWAEKISSRGFSACVLKASRLERETPDNGLTFIDYIAYEGAPKGAVAGEESLVSWWDGTHCRSVNDE